MRSSSRRTSAISRRSAPDIRAPVASLGVARSAVTVTVTAAPGGHAKVTLEPDAGDYVKLVKSEVTSATAGHTRIRVDAKPRPDHLEVEVSGSDPRRDRVQATTRASASTIPREVRRRGVPSGVLADRGIKIGKRGVRIGSRAADRQGASRRTTAHRSRLVAARHEQAQRQLPRREPVQDARRRDAPRLPVPRAGPMYRRGPGVSRQDRHRSRAASAPTTARGSTTRATVSAHQLVTAPARRGHADYRIGPDLRRVAAGRRRRRHARRKRWHGLAAARPRARQDRHARQGRHARLATSASTANHPLAFAIVVNDIPAGQRAPHRVRWPTT